MSEVGVVDPVNIDVIMNQPERVQPGAASQRPSPIASDPGRPLRPYVDGLDNCPRRTIPVGGPTTPRAVSRPVGPVPGAARDRRRVRPLTDVASAGCAPAARLRRLRCGCWGLGDGARV